MEPPLRDQALKIPPVAGFSEGAGLQGRFVVGAGGKKNWNGVKILTFDTASILLKKSRSLLTKITLGLMAMACRAGTWWTG